MDWLGDFFSALPQVFVLLWEFGDGWFGLAVTAGTFAIFAVLALVARQSRDGHGWVSAICGSLAGFVAVWWLLGILPSAWFYFADGQRDFLGGRVIPTALPGMDNFYDVFRDTIVLVITGVGIVVLGLAFAWVQRNYPRGLAEGEEKGAASGGYK